MKVNLQHLIIFVLTNFLIACQTNSIFSQPHNASSKLTQAIASSTASAYCKSLNLGDNLLPQLGSSSLHLNLPLARLNNPKQGRTVVLLPTGDSSIRFFWMHQNDQEQWLIAEKQTVVQIQEGRIDASPMHRLYYNNQQQKVVLFMTLPSIYWQRGITIKPILEESESRWGRLQSFDAQLTSQGFTHPFRGVDQGLSGNSLPPRLAKIMSQLAPGSIYVPRIYKNKITLLDSGLVNRHLCPPGSS